MGTCSSIASGEVSGPTMINVAPYREDQEPALRSLECPVCHDQFTDPRVLPCQHTFCMHCLQNLLWHQPGNDTFSCPVCRAGWKLSPSDVSNLPRNIIAMEWIESVHPHDTGDIAIDTSAGPAASIDRGTGFDRGVKKLNVFTTKCSTNVKGMVFHLNHLFIVHSNDDKLYVYAEGRRFKRSVTIYSKKDKCRMISPWGMCLIRYGCSHILMISDYSGSCLWWMPVHKLKKDISIGKPEQYRLDYKPWGVSADNNSDSVMVAHPDKNCICFYCLNEENIHKKKPKTGLKLSYKLKLASDIRPWQVLSGHSDGFVVMNQQLVWVNKSCQVTHCYTDQPAVLRPSDIIEDGTDVLVSDPGNHCIHIVTSQGRHDGYLITDIDPTCVCLDLGGQRMWLAYKGKGKKIHVMEMSYTPRPQTLPLPGKNK